MLTEVVLEAREPGHGLCHATAGEAGGRAVARVLSEAPDGSLTGFVAATPAAAERLLAAAADGPSRTDVVRRDAAVVLRVREAAASPTFGPLPPLMAARDVFGPDVLVGSAVADEGRLRLRLLLLEGVPTRDVADALQDLQGRLGWAGFRIVRVAAAHGRHHVEAVRCVLGPDEETLARRALEMGYYQTPRHCTLADVAAALEVSVSPVHKRLKRMERTLVTRYLAPEDVAPPRWRGKDRQLADHLPPLTEVTLKVTWPASPLASWAAKREGTRVLLERVAEDPAAGRATALVVVAARPAKAAELVNDLHDRDDVVEVCAGSRGSDHLAMKIATSTPPESAWGEHANPVPRLAACLGDDVLLRPLLVEGVDAWMRVVLLNGSTLADLEERCRVAAREGGWKDVETVAARPLSAAAALLGAAAQADLTARQEDVLRVAHALGYYETPKRSTLEDVARTLGTSPNAVHKSLAAAEQKLVHAHVASDL